MNPAFPRRRWLIAAIIVVFLTGSCSSTEAEPVSNGSASGSTSSPIEEEGAVGAATVVEPLGTLDGTATEFEPVGSPAWQEVSGELFDADPQTYFGAVAATTEGLVVVGGVHDPDREEWEPMAWTMDDADPATATAAALPRLAPVNALAFELAAVPNDDGTTTLVAAGTVGRGTDARVAVWRHDGEGWAAVPSDAFRATGAEHIENLELSDDGSLWLSAIGNSYSPRSIALWSSEDGGSTWVREEPPAPSTPDENADIVVRGVAHGDGRTVVAARRRTTKLDGVVWLKTTEGFEEVTPASMSGEGPIELTDAARLPGGGFVIVGAIRAASDWNPVAWTSPDGRDWKRTQFFDEDEEAGTRRSNGYGVEAVALDGDRLIAWSTGGFLQQVWTSTDGGSWEATAAPWPLDVEGVDIEDLVTVDGRIVAVTADSRLAVLGADGWEFAKIDPSVAPRQEQHRWAEDIAAVGDRFVVVGGTTASEDDGGSAAAWTDTGEGWQPMAIDATAGPIATIVSAPSADDRSRFGDALALAPDRFRTREQNGVSGGTQVLTMPAGSDRFTPLGTELADNGSYAYDLAVGGGQAMIGTTDPSLLVIGDGGRGPVPIVDDDSEDFSEIGGLCSIDGREVALLNVWPDDRDAVVARSRTAGDEWTETELYDTAASGDDGAVISGCVRREATAIAWGTVTGADGNSDGWLWESFDGRTWAPLTPPDDLAVPDSSEWIEDVATTDDRLVIAGVRIIENRAVGTLWVEDDGGRWVTVPAGSDAVDLVPREVAVDATGRILVLGSGWGQQTLWQADLATLLADP